MITLVLYGEDSSVFTLIEDALEKERKKLSIRLERERSKRKAIMKNEIFIFRLVLESFLCRKNETEKFIHFDSAPELYTKNRSLSIFDNEDERASEHR